jgi:hypothetical protein
MTQTSVEHSRWLNYAACLWALGFATPHVWWALGSSVGFPGGPASHRLLMESGWRYAFDLVVIAMSLLGAVVACGLGARRFAKQQKIFKGMAWTAAALLVLRGVAGLVVDRQSDPIWWPTFLTGGLLFGAVAFTSRHLGRPESSAVV